MTFLISTIYIFLNILIVTLINIIIVTTLTHFLKNFRKEFNPVIKYTSKSFKEKFDKSFEKTFNYFRWDFLNSLTGQLCFQYSFCWCVASSCRGHFMPLSALVVLVTHADFENPFNPGEQIISNFVNYNTYGPEYFKLVKNPFEQAACTSITIATQRKIDFTYVNTSNFQESIEKTDGITEKRFLADTTRFFKILRYYCKCVWINQLDPEMSKHHTMGNHFYECITDNRKTPHRHFCVQYINAKEGFTYNIFYTVTSTGIPAGTARVAEILSDHSNNKYVSIGTLKMVGLSELTGSKTSLISPTGKFVKIDETLISDCQQILYTKGTLLQIELQQSIQMNPAVVPAKKLLNTLNNNREFLDILGLYPMKEPLSMSTAPTLANKIIAFDMSTLKANIRTDLTILPQVQLKTPQCSKNLEIAMQTVENTKTLSPIQRHLNATTIGKIMTEQAQCIHVNHLHEIATHPVTNACMKHILNLPKKI